MFGVVSGGREPEGRGEGDVDFFEAAIGDVVDCGCDLAGQRRGKGVLMAFEPAEGRGHDDFVEDEGGGGCGGGEGDRGVAGGGGGGGDGGDGGGEVEC